MDKDKTSRNNNFVGKGRKEESIKQPRLALELRKPDACGNKRKRLFQRSNVSHSVEKLNKIYIDTIFLVLETRSSFEKAICVMCWERKPTLQWVEMSQRDGILNIAEGSGLR